MGHEFISLVQIGLVDAAKIHVQARPADLCQQPGTELAAVIAGKLLLRVCFLEEQDTHEQAEQHKSRAYQIWQQKRKPVKKSARGKE